MAAHVTSAGPAQHLVALPRVVSNVSSLLVSSDEEQREDGEDIHEERDDVGPYGATHTPPAMDANGHPGHYAATAAAAAATAAAGVVRLGAPAGYGNYVHILLPTGACEDPMLKTSAAAMARSPSANGQIAQFSPTNSFPRGVVLEQQERSPAAGSTKVQKQRKHQEQLQASTKITRTADSSRNAQESALVRLEAEKLRAENQRLLKQLEEKDDKIRFLQGKVDTLSKHVDEFRQLPTGKISQIPIPYVSLLHTVMHALCPSFFLRAPLFLFLFFQGHGGIDARVWQ